MARGRPPSRSIPSTFLQKEGNLLLGACQGKPGVTRGQKEGAAIRFPDHRLEFLMRDLLVPGLSDLGLNTFAFRIVTDKTDRAGTLAAERLEEAEGRGLRYMEIVRDATPELAIRQEAGKKRYRLGLRILTPAERQRSR